jgi:hypothetical protein
MIAEKKHDASIPVVVPVIIPIVMVPMMVPVPSLPAVFIRVVVVAVTVVTIVVRSVFLVSGANVNAKPIVCLGLGGCQSNEPERRQSQEEISFRKGNSFHAALRFGSGCSLTPREIAGI